MFLKRTNNENSYQLNHFHSLTHEIIVSNENTHVEEVIRCEKCTHYLVDNQSLHSIFPQQNIRLLREDVRTAHTN